LEYRQAVHSLVEKVDSALGLIKNEMLSSLKSISFEDLGYLYLTTLKKDGETLGDYLAWLASQNLSHRALVHVASHESVRRLNQLTFDELPPLNSAPATDLAEFYGSAVTEPIHDGWDAHPHAAKDDKEEQLPRLKFGDILACREQKSLWMVLNAPCDLAMAPGENRGANPRLSVLLLEGEPIPLTDRFKDEWGPRTEFFQFEAGGTPYRIRWLYQNSRAIAYANIRSEFGDKYDRKLRLRESYALEIQRAYAESITRRGMQVTPPIPIGRKVHAYFKNEKQQFESLGDLAVPGAHLFGHGKKPSFILTNACVEWLFDMTQKAIKRLESGKTDDEQEKTAKARAKNIELLTQLAQSIVPDCQFQLKQTTIPGASKSTSWPEGQGVVPLLAVHNAPTLEGGWKGGGVLAISLDVADEDEGATDGAE
jgi:hypothetical protein